MASLMLKITSGELKGQEFELQNGLVVGRRQAALALHDTKVSSRHAIIEKNEKNQWLIRDLGSRNGLFIDGKKASEGLLVAGVRLRIGSTELEILPSRRSQLWREATLNLLRSLALEDKPRTLLPFEPVVRLEPQEGSRLKEPVYLGYGPRVLGPLSCDLPLYGDGLPDECLTLSPEGSKARLTTPHPQFVQVNGQSVESVLLEDGDLIDVGSHKIKVFYEND